MRKQERNYNKSVRRQERKFARSMQQILRAGRAYIRSTRALQERCSRVSLDVLCAVNNGLEVNKQLLAGMTNAERNWLLQNARASSLASQ